MLVCSGVFGVLYVFRDERRGGGLPEIGRDKSGGIGLMARLVGPSDAAHQVRGAKDEEGVQFTHRILASAYCSGAVSNGGDMVLYIAGVLYCFLGLAIVCDEFFQTSLEIISEVLGLTPDVAGATFLAAGSSAPELFTSLVDAFGHANSTGTGTIVGSAMFNILVIVALSAAVAGSTEGAIHIDWRPVCRDIIFYSYSIAILALVFIDEKVQWWEGLIMFLSYVVYIIFMKYNSRILSHCQPPKIGITDDLQASSENINAAVAAVSAAKRPSMTGNVGIPGPGEDTAKVTPLSQANAAAAESASAGVGAEEAAAAAEAGATGTPGKSFTLGIRNRVERRLSGNSTVVDENKPLVLADQNQATADEENGGASGQAAGSAAEGAAAGAVDDKMVEGKKGEDAEKAEEEEEGSRFAWPEKRVDQVRCD